MPALQMSCMPALLCQSSYKTPFLDFVLQERMRDTRRNTTLNRSSSYIQYRSYPKLREGQVEKSRGRKVTFDFENKHNLATDT